jgi:catechol 2,3-dioxygenase-like lactoylglutathione lyase family enzyme
MTARPHNITFDCADPYRLAGFWSEVTGYREDPDNGNAPEDPEGLLVGPDGQPNLLFIRVPEAKTVKNRVHLDLMPTQHTRDQEVARLLELGAVMVADRRRPDGTGWVVLADPEGNEFCVERRPQSARQVRPPSADHRHPRQLTWRCEQPHVENL